MTWRSDVTGVRIDGANGSLVDISTWTNNANPNRSFPFLDDTGLGDIQEQSVGGLPNAARVPMNGRLCSTTEAIFGPLLAAGTSITKTLELKLRSGRYLIAEIWPEDVAFNPVAKELTTWSFTALAQNGFTRTSVAAS